MTSIRDGLMSDMIPLYNMYQYLMRSGVEDPRVQQLMPTQP